MAPSVRFGMGGAARRGGAGVAEQIAVLTLATIYLQRLWSVRLTLAFGYPPCFPEQRFAFLLQGLRDR